MQNKQIIFDIINNSKEHLSAEQIFLLAKEVSPSIALGTIYRNLNLMVEHDEIARVDVSGEPSRFDKKCVPHYHAKCINCGKLSDIKLDGVDELISGAVNNLVNYNLSINYICCDCKNKKNTNGGC